MAADVITQVVEKGLCIGCGTCVAICPRGVLEMTCRPDGDYAVQRNADCPEGCDLCLEVCPLAGGIHLPRVLNVELHGPPAREDTSYDESIGWHHSAWVGYSRADEHRANAASGGLLTWFLEELLTRDMVDRVTVVRRSAGGERLFGFESVERAEDVRGAAGTVYYPVSIDGILRQVAGNRDVRWAIVGVPCLAAGVRRAVRGQPARLGGVKFVLGLACGMLQNDFYTSALTRRSGVKPDDVGEIRYRLKACVGTSGNYRFRAWRADGTPGRDVPYHGLPLYLGRTGCFRYNACNYCGDVFAEAADACFMDAWLPEYACEFEGTSIVVVRNPELADLAERGRREGRLEIAELDASKVRASQAHHVRRKQVLIRMRTGRRDITKVDPDARIGMYERLAWRLEKRTQRRSRSAWRRWGSRYGLTAFNAGMTNVRLAWWLLDGLRRIGSKLKHLLKPK